jgi:hypothetical protein
MDVHLATWNELDVLPSLPELISVKPRVTETVHLTVIGERPAIETILETEVDMLLRVTETIEGAEPRMAV